MYLHSPPTHSNALSVSVDFCIVFFLSLLFFVCFKCLSTLNKTFKFIGYIRRRIPILFFGLILLFLYEFAKMFNRSCYLLIVSIVSSRCRIRMHTFLNHRVWSGFYVQWPAILSADCRGRFASLQILLKFRAPKMERSFEFGGSLLHVSWNCRSRRTKFDQICAHGNRNGRDSSLTIWFFRVARQAARISAGRAHQNAIR